MTKRFLALTAIGALAAIGLVTPVTATAASAGPVTVTDREDAYRWHSWWYTEAECRSRGAAGSRQGVWTSWYCQPRAGATTWDLFVDDRCRICVARTDSA